MNSSKLPVTDLYGAPLRGTDSNLHWYKFAQLPYQAGVLIDLSVTLPLNTIRTLCCAGL